MPTATDNVASVNESTLELVTSIQERIVEANKKFATTVAGVVPELPSSFPKPDLSDAPDPKSLVEQSFEFQTQLLEANKAFSLGLISAWLDAAPKPAQEAGGIDQEVTADLADALWG